MYFEEQFNKVTFDVDVNGFEFVTLKDLYKKDKGKGVYHIAGMYVSTKGKFGDAPVFIDAVNKKLINIPAHELETVQKVLKDKYAIDLIKDDKVGFKIYEYESHNRKCYGVRYVDFVPLND